MEGIVEDDDEAAAAALGSNALALGSAALEGCTPTAGAFGLDCMDIDVCTISNLLIKNNMASGS